MPFFIAALPLTPTGAKSMANNTMVLLRVTPVPNTGATDKLRVSIARTQALQGMSPRLLVAPLPLSQAKAWAPGYRSWLLGLKDKYGEPAYMDAVFEYLPLVPNGPPGTLFPQWPTTTVQAWWETQPGSATEWRLVGSPLKWVSVTPSRDQVASRAV